METGRSLGCAEQSDCFRQMSPGSQERHSLSKKKGRWHLGKDISSWPLTSICAKAHTDMNAHREEESMEGERERESKCSLKAERLF